MDEIKICLVIMENTKGILNEIEKVTLDTPSFINAKGIFISTFTTNKSISELKNFFKDKKRNFLMFEIDEATSAYHFLNEKLENGLFMFAEIEKDNNDVWEGVNLLDNKDMDSEITEKSILKMTKEEKDIKLNELIDKGIENLSDGEKNILNLLAT
jgi:hypothetical protein